MIAASTGDGPALAPPTLNQSARRAVVYVRVAGSLRGMDTPPATPIARAIDTDAANQAGQSINAPSPLPTCDGKPTWDPFEAGGGPESSAPSPGFSLH